MTTVAGYIARASVAIFNPLIVLLIAVAATYFLWGAVQFIANSDDAVGREEGKRKIMWGIVGLTIMTSAFAIINIVLRTFDIAPIS